MTWLGGAGSSPPINDPSAFASWMSANGLLAPGGAGGATGVAAAAAAGAGQPTESVQQAQNFLQHAMAIAQNQRTSTGGGGIPGGGSQGPNFGKVSSRRYEFSANFPSFSYFLSNVVSTKDLRFLGWSFRFFTFKSFGNLKWNVTTRKGNGAVANAQSRS
jgi:hypothetical protein